MDCSPSALVDSAKCFDCTNRVQRDWIKTYLLAEIAGVSADPETLVAAAKCFSCLTVKQLKEIQVLLLCLIVNK